MLTSVWTSASGTDYEHDLAGRVSRSVQHTSGLDDKAFTYSYYASDVQASVVYPLPSQRTVVTCVDAQLRPLWVSGTKSVADCVNNATVPAAEAYASGMQYGSYGLLTQMTLGNGLTEATQYNNRLQTTQRSLASLWTQVNHYGTTNNTGNVRKQVLTVPGMTTLTPVYSYDFANRLDQAAEYKSDRSEPACPDATSAWCEDNDYDQWGNRLKAVGTPAIERRPCAKPGRACWLLL
ncbi:MAG: hypothetical protein LLG20_09025 [Acidobacteriales bacterium]|nr:hypothetical protein [Terriglobales bacterium]